MAIVVDSARAWTDKQLEQIEEYLRDIYKKASKDITKKWNEFMEESDKTLKNLQDEYDFAKKTEDKKLIRKTGIALQKAKKEITLGNEYYRDMVKETASQLAKVNQTAVAYVNGQVLSVYTMNFNQKPANFDALNTNIRFNLVDEYTVKRMNLTSDLGRRLSIPKDMRWNTKQINSSVLQGIIQGEPISKISERLYPIMNKNEASAMRNARTMVGRAENKGRLDRYKDLADKGVVGKKVWIATADGRTRDWHIEMDGQEVEIDESFIDGLGNELECPCDGGAPPETVYNCRCTMKMNIIGFRKSDGHINYINYDKSKDGKSLHDKQIDDEKKRRK